MAFLWASVFLSALLMVAVVVLWRMAGTINDLRMQNGNLKRDLRALIKARIRGMK